MNNTTRAIAGLFVGLVILGVWLYFVGFEETLGNLATVTPGPAILATFAWVLSMVLRGWKWHRILVFTQAVPWLVSEKVYWLSSFLNVLFPFRVGELARSLFLKRLVEMPVSASLPTVLVDRLYSVAVILLSLLFLPLTSFRLGSPFGWGGIRSQLADPGAAGFRWGVGIAAAGFMTTLVALYVLRNHRSLLLGLGRKLLYFLPNRLADPLFGFADATLDSMRIVRSDAWSTLQLLGLSVAVLLADALKDHFVLRAFGLRVPVVECFFGVGLTNLAFILPSPPAGIGSNEWYATLVYTAGFGYDRTRVASGALFGHLMTTLVVAAGGALSLSSLGISLTESLRIGTPMPPQSEANP
jgi:uncharacterized membrane protein YbhN (UPF0104 family)